MKTILALTIALLISSPVYAETQKTQLKGPPPAPPSYVIFSHPVVYWASSDNTTYYQLSGSASYTGTNTGYYLGFNYTPGRYYVRACNDFGCSQYVEAE